MCIKHDHGSLRCGGMSLTLISLAELGVVLRGLYFFSTGGASDRAELEKETWPSLKFNRISNRGQHTQHVCWMEWV